ncbi:uncharacterized protein B0P05DRAFT_539097 [Gilbertella persicaria]|uniref:Translational machinery component n=1 Tax=Rhizopus stolonifer TaxID=4846 RepID=A0A367KKQ6_RHIST|nr:uncharacterized protein B0P05DRAFT_539097 [Gilbertella persicaria]KAI8080668.1 hypothetical protein B0P05DRAFT_539097 [Gilbertella persicaria]RCI02749.1 hypothetical protein CU098_009822 [Rhizopus stolonifer]
MLAIKHTIPKVCTQIARPTLLSRRWISTTPQSSDEKNSNTTQYDGILSVLGQSKTDAESSSSASSLLPNKNDKGFPIGLESISATLSTMNQPPFQLHINATFNNTIITLTRPNGAPLVTTSGGSAGFKKAARSGYEAAHQAAIQLLDKMNAKNVQVSNVHIVLKGFGPGRDAAFKALVSGTSWNVKRITDATPTPFGGCRPKKARRL